MGIRQQKREKPNKFAKTGNATTVSLPNAQTVVSAKTEKRPVKSVYTPSPATQFLIRDLTRTAVAFVIALIILGAIWWAQTK